MGGEHVSLREHERYRPLYPLGRTRERRRRTDRLSRGSRRERWRGKRRWYLAGTRVVFLDATVARRRRGRDNDRRRNRGDGRGRYWLNRGRRRRRSFGSRLWRGRAHSGLRSRGDGRRGRRRCGDRCRGRRVLRIGRSNHSESGTPSEQDSGGPQSCRLVFHSTSLANHLTD